MALPVATAKNEFIRAFRQNFAWLRRWLLPKINLYGLFGESLHSSTGALAKISLYGRFGKDRAWLRRGRSQKFISKWAVWQKSGRAPPGPTLEIDLNRPFHENREGLRPRLLL